MILLTGASGYLGRHVLAILEARRLPYVATSRSGSVGVACDLGERRAVIEVVEAVAPTMVIHCAAMVPKQPEDYENAHWCEENQLMMHNLNHNAQCPIVMASSLVVDLVPKTRYALGKWIGERWLQMREREGDVILRLPGLFGLPRRDGFIYDSAEAGVIPQPDEPKMHVTDAAEYLVRAATMPSDGNREPFSVTYGDPRLEACYGSLGVTFDQRVREFVAEVQREQVQA